MLFVARFIMMVGLLLLTIRNGYAGANCFAWGNLVGYPGANPKPKNNNFDPDLYDPWGVAFLPGGAYVVADSYVGKSTAYDGTGVKEPQVLVLPVPAGIKQSFPTGLVANPSSGAFVNPSTKNQAQFIFATIEGTLIGWNPSLATPELIVDNSSKQAVYYGLALGNNADGSFLYATNFHTGTVDVFDSNFNPATLSGTFSDPKLPTGYAPFGIANIRGNLFVTYAPQAGDGKSFTFGKGKGYVDIFDTKGNLIRSFARKTHLNSPWAVVEAPANFGSLGGDILVGNFGDGTINAYDPRTGAYKGQITDAVTKRAMSIPGLWALVFGGGLAGDPGTLYFTARLSETMYSGGFGPITPQSAKQCASGGMPY